MEDKAKVRAHGVFDVGASIDEPFKAVSPRFIFLGEMRFMKVTSISEIMVDFSLLRISRARVVGQVYTDDTMSSLAEAGKTAYLVKIIADKFGSSHQSRFKPYLAVRLNVVVVFFLTYAWPTTMSVWRQECMHPEFIVDV
jgi:hypothetical protein